MSTIGQAKNQRKMMPNSTKPNTLAAWCFTLTTAAALAWLSSQFSTFLALNTSILTVVSLWTLIIASSLSCISLIMYATLAKTRQVWLWGLGTAILALAAAMILINQVGGLTAVPFLASTLPLFSTIIVFLTLSAIQQYQYRYNRFLRATIAFLFAASCAIIAILAYIQYHSSISTAVFKYTVLPFIASTLFLGFVYFLYYSCQALGEAPIAVPTNIKDYDLSPVKQNLQALTGNNLLTSASYTQISEQLNQCSIKTGLTKDQILDHLSTHNNKDTVSSNGASGMNAFNQASENQLAEGIRFYRNPKMSPLR